MHQHLYRKNGFTLIELLVAGLLGSLVLLGGVQYFKTNDKTNKKTQQDLEETADNLNMEAIIRKDLINSKHSLNNLLLEDDTGKNFMDYLSSYSCSLDCERSIKLQVGASSGVTSKSLYFIVIDQFAGAEQIYNPADAYSEGTLSFRSMNYNNVLSTRVDTPWNDGVKTRERLIYMYAPMEVFAPAAGVEVPGRTLSFMGWVGSTNFTGALRAEKIKDNGKNYYRNNDIRTSSPITDENTFLRSIPYTSGVGTFVFLTAVKVVRYQMKTVKKDGHLAGELIRGELNSNNSFVERPIGFNLKSVEFQRKTISSPAIQIKMQNIL